MPCQRLEVFDVVANLRESTYFEAFFYFFFDIPPTLWQGKIMSSIKTQLNNAYNRLSSFYRWTLPGGFFVG